MLDEQEDTRIYKVVVNAEEQYSVWFDGRQNPLGWTDVGKTGTKQERLNHIKEIWTDITPLSVRMQLKKGRSDQPSQGASS